ncbi:uncharacterized protein LOC131957286 [Physella acuta]|uniref:uncharacterized protein LOC131957286 n=1 Tax=Physella acuta TaxID=109671 RepID=UPI0027DE3F4D|nr:uncharacterized protein LOC131957286 [Physella acuta]XP_059177993.1 uncharacterized protein LOC131957286 [Physella acuta]
MSRNAVYLNIGSENEKSTNKQTKRHDDCCQTIVLIIISTADLFLDWTFFNDFDSAKSVKHSSIVFWIWIFCCVGTVTCVAEICNHINRFMDKDELSAFCVWFEDVPQICLSLLAAIYIEQPVAGVQWFKIALVVGNLLFLLCALFDGCCESETSESRKWIKAGTFIELVIAVILAGVGWKK